MGSWAMKLRNWTIDRIMGVKKVVFDLIFDRLSKNIKDFFFIQIGACDGTQSDPIHTYILKYNWHGILVEPIRHLFNELLENYRGCSNLIFENVAITDKNEIRDIYYIKDDKKALPQYTKGVGSLLPEQITKLDKNLTNYLCTEKVKCIKVKDLLEKYNVSKVDLLQIDTEGYDYEIIKLFPFHMIKPRVIQYEHIQLTDSAREESISFLKNQGYLVIEKNADAVAFLKTREFKEIIFIAWLSNIFIFILRQIKLLKNNV